MAFLEWSAVEKRKFFVFVVGAVLGVLLSNIIRVGYAQSGFENVSSVTVDYCYHQTVTGWCSHGSKSYTRVVDWTTSFIQNNSYYSPLPSFDGGYSTNFKTEGFYASAIWWIPPNECEWDFASSTCKNQTEGISTSMYKTFTLNDTNVNLKFDLATCNFYPVKCAGWWCQDEYYGITETNGTRFTIDAYARIYIYQAGSNVTVLEGLLDRQLPENSAFKTYSINLKPLISAGNFTLYFETKPPFATWQYPVCYIVDNVRFEPRVSPTKNIEGYMTDMTTFKAITYDKNVSFTTPTTCWGGDVNYLNVSQLYDGIANAKIGVCMDTSYGVTPVTAYIYNAFLYLKNGTIVNYTDYATSIIYEGFGSAFCDQYATIRLPIPVDIVDKINLSYRMTAVGFYCNFISTIKINEIALNSREFYGNKLINGEIVTGKPHLYPFIAYGGILTGNIFNVTVFNLLGITQTPYIELWHLSKEGTPKGYDKISTSLPAFNKTTVSTELINPISTDYMIVNYTHGLSVAETKILLLPELACLSECIGSDYYEGVLISGVCIYKIYPNDARCLAVPPPEVPKEIAEVKWTEPEPTVCNVTEMKASGTQWALPFCTPLFWMVMIMLIVSGVLGYGVTKAGMTGEIGAVAFVSSILLFSILYLRYGIFEAWIGVIFIIAEGMILAYLLQKIFIR
jgi:hypothetical protein